MASTKITTPPLNPSRLKEGDWIETVICGEKTLFYVTKNTEYSLTLGCLSWLASSTSEVLYSEFISSEYLSNARYIGHSKKRWYWKLLPGRDRICPYTRPKKSKWRRRT
jgi:hypothetical protein